jgi:hypothetical protein
LLTENENETKQDKPFEKWVQNQNSGFYERHFIPEEEQYHKLENFDQFISVRRERIKDFLLSLLTDSGTNEEQ